MSLKLYHNLYSPSSRAIYIFLKINNIPFQKKIADIKDNFQQFNKFRTLPIIDDDGFQIIESNAILRYLIREKSVVDHWFPKDSRKQARVDEYLEWHHHNTGFLCNFYVMRAEKESKKELVEEAKYRMVACLEKIENIWLEDKMFLAGNDISIADIVASCDLEQTKMAGYDFNKDFPKISEWINHVRAKLNPYYDEAHYLLNKTIECNRN